MGVQVSSPFKSADGRATYVELSTGQRRRVEIIDNEIVFMTRPRKALKRALKRMHTRERRIEARRGN